LVVSGLSFDIEMFYYVYYHPAFEAVKVKPVDVWHQPAGM
jgi:hypothetical protein